MGRMLIVATALTLLAGCTPATHISTTVVADKYAARPVPEDDVQVFFADDSIPEHDIVATFDAESDAPKRKMIEEFRKHAGRLGANAIIVMELRDTSVGEVVAEAILEGLVSGILGGPSGSADTPLRRGQVVAIYCESLDRRS